jgi:hypothetical protein
MRSNKIRSLRFFIPVLGGYLSLFYKPLVPVIKTLEILLLQFQENSESKNLQFQFFWVKKPQREPVLFIK